MIRSERDARDEQIVRESLDRGIAQAEAGHVSPLPGPLAEYLADLDDDWDDRSSIELAEARSKQRAEFASDPPEPPEGTPESSLNKGHDHAAVPGRTDCVRHLRAVEGHNNRRRGQ